jgi:hypothetical protein
MARPRFFVSIAFVMLASVGFVNGQEGTEAEDAVVEAPQANPVVLGGVEICGPIYEAALFLGPKDASGKLDRSRIELWPHPSGLYRAVFQPPPGLEMEFAGQSIFRVYLGEFEGRTQQAVAVWTAGGDVLLEVWSDMIERLRVAIGEPADESDGYVMWEAGALRTIIDLDVESEIATLSYDCMPTEDEFWARVNSVPETEAPPDASRAASDYRPGERDLGMPLLSVLAAYGEPTAGPYRPGPTILGFYYEDIEFMGIPCNGWVWFVDGVTVYKGFEFAPPFGPRRAIEAFDGFSEILNQWHGEPLAIIGGEKFDRMKSRWLNGGEENVLTLEMADDPPWFRLEVIDRDKIHSIEGDLRPARKPLRRYIPPPRDSGKTREELASGDARG